LRRRSKEEKSLGVRFRNRRMAKLSGDERQVALLAS
jgi:hypothetical protein